MPIAEVLCSIFYVGQNSADISCFLSSHAAVLVEIERRVTHEARSHQCAERRPNRPS